MTLENDLNKNVFKTTLINHKTESIVNLFYNWRFSNNLELYIQLYCKIVLNMHFIYFLNTCQLSSLSQHQLV